MGIGALICGILSLVGGFIPGVNYGTGVLAIVAIVLGVLGKTKDPEHAGMAKAGMIMGIVAIAITVIVTIACLACYGAAASSILSAAKYY